MPSRASRLKLHASLAVAQVTGHFIGHTKTVSALQCSSDSQLLFSGSDDRTLRIWSVLDCSCLYTLQQHPAQVGAAPSLPSPLPQAPHLQPHSHEANRALAPSGAGLGHRSLPRRCTRARPQVRLQRGRIRGQRRAARGRAGQSRAQVGDAVQLRVRARRLPLAPLEARAARRPAVCGALQVGAPAHALRGFALPLLRVQ